MNAGLRASDAARRSPRASSAVFTPVEYPAWQRSRDELSHAISVGAGAVALVGALGTGRTLLLEATRTTDSAVPLTIIDDVDGPALKRLASTALTPGTIVLAIEPDLLGEVVALFDDVRVVRMRPMTSADVRHMIEARREQAGHPAETLTARAVLRLETLCAGNPLTLDSLLARANLVLQASGAAQLTAEHVDTAATLPRLGRKPELATKPRLRLGPASRASAPTPAITPFHPAGEPQAARPAFARRSSAFAIMALAGITIAAVGIGPLIRVVGTRAGQPDTAGPRQLARSEPPPAIAADPATRATPPSFAAAAPAEPEPSPAMVPSPPSAAAASPDAPQISTSLDNGASTPPRSLGSSAASPPDTTHPGAAAELPRTVAPDIEPSQPSPTVAATASEPLVSTGRPAAPPDPGNAGVVAEPMAEAARGEPDASPPDLADAGRAAELPRTAAPDAATGQPSAAVAAAAPEPPVAPTSPAPPAPERPGPIAVATVEAAQGVQKPPPELPHAAIPPDEPTAAAPNPSPSAVATAEHMAAPPTDLPLTPSFVRPDLSGDTSSAESAVATASPSAAGSLSAPRQVPSTVDATEQAPITLSHPSAVDPESSPAATVNTGQTPTAPPAPLSVGPVRPRLPEGMPPAEAPAAVAPLHSAEPDSPPAPAPTPVVAAGQPLESAPDQREPIVPVQPNLSGDAATTIAPVVAAPPSLSEPNSAASSLSSDPVGAEPPPIPPMPAPTVPAASSPQPAHAATPAPPPLTTAAASGSTGATRPAQRRDPAEAARLLALGKTLIAIGQLDDAKALLLASARLGSVEAATLAERHAPWTPPPARRPVSGR